MSRRLHSGAGRRSSADDAQLVSRLRVAMTDETRGHHLQHDTVLVAVRHLPPDDASRAVDAIDIGPSRRHPDRQPRRHLAALVTGLAVTVALVAAAILLLHQPHTTPKAPTAVGPAGCGSSVVYSELPSWARDGFIPPTAPQRHIMGVHGEIVAVLFTQGLYVPPRPGQSNKILWVARQGGQPLVIHARRSNSPGVVVRTVASGPGPSTINLPAAGCWTLTLSWSGHHDTLDVPYTGR
jgi:hypothetical protein